MKKPYRKHTIPQYDFGGWLKKNAGTIGTIAGGLGAIALTGGLAAPAIAPALAGAGGAAAATGATAGAIGTAAGTGLASTLGTASLGANLGGKLGGAIQQNEIQKEAINSQNQAIMNQRNASINAQAKFNPNNPVFKCGGVMKYPGGGDIPTTTPQPQTLDKQLGLDMSLYDTMTPGRKYLAGFTSLDDPKIYEGISQPEALGTYTSIFKEMGDKGIPYRAQFINNWNKMYGKDLGYFYDPNRTSGLGLPIEKDNPQYQNLYDTYYPQVPTDRSYNLRSTEGYPLNAAKYTPKFERGGYSVDSRGFANSELEDKEVYRTPQGNMFKVNGRTHAEGGEIYNLPEGTEILGKNIIPGTNTSYKKYGDKLMKDYNKFAKILSEKHTPLAKKTAVAMMDKTQQEFTNLMNLQESEKGYHQMSDGSMMANEDMEQYPDGGIIEYKSGGWIQKAINPSHRGFCTPMTKSTCTPHRKALARRFKSGDLSKHANGDIIRQAQIDYQNTVNTNLQNLDYNVNPESPTIQPLSVYDPNVASDLANAGTNKFSTKPFDWKKAMGYIGTAAIASPILYNVAQGIFGKTQKLNASDYYNPAESEVNRLMSNRRYNVNPELESNRTAQSNYTRALRQGAPSQAQYMGNIQNSQIARSRADAEAYARKQNLDNTYLGEEAQMRGTLGAQRAQTKLAIQDINDKNRAAKKNYLSTALTQMQQLGQLSRTTEGLKDKDEKLMDIYRNVYRGYSFVPKYDSVR